MSSKANEEKLELNGGLELAESTDLAQIRGILFGNQIREIDSRLRRLEEQFLTEMESIANQISVRFAKMEERLLAGQAELAKEIQEEMEARSKSDQDLDAKIDRLLNSDMAAMNKALSAKVSSVREDLGALANENKASHKEIKTDYSKEISRLNKELDGVRASKTERQKLAKMYREMAKDLESNK